MAGLSNADEIYPQSQSSEDEYAQELLQQMLETNALRQTPEPYGKSFEIRPDMASPELGIPMEYRPEEVMQSMKAKQIYGLPETIGGSAGNDMESIIRQHGPQEQRGYRGPEISPQEFDKRQEQQIESGQRPEDPMDITGGQHRYKGQPGSPDLPSEADIQHLGDIRDTDEVQQFVDRFGWERLTNPQGPPTGYVPTPRDRLPHMDPNNPLGPLTLEPGDIQGQLREKDLQDLIDEGLSEADKRMLARRGLMPEGYKRKFR